MPQLDKLTYFSQFFWFLLFFFTFYILICNNGDGLLGISRIFKLRNQLISNQGNKIQSKDPEEEILIKVFRTGVSNMYSTLFEVSQWCKTTFDDYLGQSLNSTQIASLGGISSLGGIEKNICDFISNSKRSYNTSSSRITNRNHIVLLYVLSLKKRLEKGEYTFEERKALLEANEALLRSEGFFLICEEGFTLEAILERLKDSKEEREETLQGLEALFKRKGFPIPAARSVNAFLESLKDSKEEK
nr:ATP synthase subunit 8 [Gahnia tristis]